MKTILVPVEPHDLMESVLRTAKLLASGFGSYVEGLALSPVLSPFLAADAVGGAVVYEADVRADDSAVREARQVFDRGMGSSPLVGWLNGIAQDDGFVGTYGRVFDVTVLGRPGTAAGSPRMSTLESSLFESGRPVLIAPPAAPEKLGEVVAVAWNRSAETARTVAFAMPILKKARRVSLLSIEGGSVVGPDGDQLARYLERNGIATQLIAITKTDAKSVGPAVLERAAKFGSDLLVKGAFTQSRISQMIFGGATRHILAEATLPVFMAH